MLTSYRMVSNQPTLHSPENYAQREAEIFRAYQEKFAPLSEKMKVLATKQMNLFGRQDRKALELSDRWMDSINMFFNDIRNSNTDEGEYSSLDYLEKQFSINLDAYTEALERMEKFTKVVESPATLAQRAEIRKEIENAFNEIDKDKTMSNTIAITYSLFAKLFAQYVPEGTEGVQKVVKQTNASIAEMMKKDQ